MSVRPLDDGFAVHAGPWTEEEWLALPESLGRVELLDGSLIVSPLPGYSHQRMVRNLAQALERAAPHECEVFPGGNVRVRAGGILIPDIIVVTPPGLELKIVDAAAVSIVVEVTSPSTAWSDRLVKPEAYARAGIPCYLRIDLDRGVDQVGAVLYTLDPDGVYAEAARATETGRLMLDRPFPVDLDLTILATATRYPRR